MREEIIGRVMGPVKNLEGHRIGERTSEVRIKSSEPEIGHGFQRNEVKRGEYHD